MSAIRRSKRSRATTHRPHRGGTGLWRSHSCSLRYSWLGAGAARLQGLGPWLSRQLPPHSTGHAKGQVWGGGGHAADEAGDGGWEDGPRCLPRQVHSTPPHRGQVVGRACGVLACVAGVGLHLVGVGRCWEGSSTGLPPRADCVCLAGASTPRMTTHTASATPLNTSLTPSAPRSSRPGEHCVQHGPGLSRNWQGSSVVEQLAMSQQLPKCWGMVCLRGCGQA